MITLTRFIGLTLIGCFSLFQLSMSYADNGVVCTAPGKSAVSGGCFVVEVECEKGGLGVPVFLDSLDPNVYSKYPEFFGKLNICDVQHGPMVKLRSVIPTNNYSCVAWSTVPGIIGATPYPAVACKK